MSIPDQGLDKDTYTGDEVRHLVAREVMRHRMDQYERQQSMVKEEIAKIGNEVVTSNKMLMAEVGKLYRHTDECRDDLRKEIDREFASKTDLIKLESKVDGLALKIQHGHRPGGITNPTWNEVSARMTTIATLLPYGLRNNINPNLVVVHSMAEDIVMDNGEVLFAVDLLAKLKLSAHRLVAPNGDEYICRKDNQGAFHAKGFNEGSLGIEFLVPGKMNYTQFLERIKTPYVTDAQLGTGTRIVREWIDAYDILTVARHSDLSPGVKFDPGDGFPWDSFLTDLGV